MWTKDEEEAALDSPELSSRDLSEGEYRSYLVDDPIGSYPTDGTIESQGKGRERRQGHKKRIVKPKKNSAKKKVRGDVAMTFRKKTMMTVNRKKNSFLEIDVL